MRLRCSEPCRMQRLMRLGPGLRLRLQPARHPGAMPPTTAELQMWADEAIAGNLYEKIMDALSQTKYYQYLNGNDILDLIPEGLCLSEDQPGYLSCRHCLNKKSRRNQRWGGQSVSQRIIPNSFLTDQLSSAAAASTTPSPGPCPAPPSAPGHLVAVSAEAEAEVAATPARRPPSGQAWRRASWRDPDPRPPKRGLQACISPLFWRPPRQQRWFLNLLLISWTRMFHRVLRQAHTGLQGSRPGCGAQVLRTPGVASSSLQDACSDAADVAWRSRVR